MSYVVNLRDKSEAIVSNLDGEAIGLMLLQVKRPDYVEINGATYRTNEIVSVKLLPDEPAPVTLEYLQTALPDDKAIAAGPVCKAQRSIQKEINSIAKATGPGWAKKITSEKWREAIRQKLHKATPDWCDYRAGTCACD